MRLYRDRDADLGLLEGRRIAVIGYGNQGRAQALNLRDSGQDVIVGNREDSYAERAREDGFSVLPIAQAVPQAEVVVVLIPDEVTPEVFEGEIAPHLGEGDVLVFASAYNIAFEFVAPPPFVDVVLVAPRMIGAGVRDLYLEGSGFPSFIGVAQDYSGQAKRIALSMGKGIGSTRAGVVEVTFAQEAELDLFTEQCFGPAFGRVLTTAVDLLLDEGYPPEAVLLELYMSGELSYTLGKIAELGLIEQGTLHSRTSQYGSMSRGMRFMLPELRGMMLEGLEEIRSGQFAREWAAEQAAGCPALEALKESARSLPLHQFERELREALKGFPSSQQAYVHRKLERSQPDLPPAETARAVTGVPASRGGLVRRLWSRLRGEVWGLPPAASLSPTQMQEALRGFLVRAEGDAALRDFSRGREMTSHYVLHEPDLEFYMYFEDGQVSTGLGAPPSPAEVRLETKAQVLDGMFTGRINAMRAAMTGRLSFGGDAKLAITLQQIQSDLCRLYVEAREEVAPGRR
jgi:ketol-acid reductoisomerase